MRGIAEIHLVAVNADPARAQPAGDIAADRGRHHRDDDEIKSGADLEGGGRNARAGPRRNHGKAKADAEREQERVSARRLTTAPAATAAQETPATEGSPVSAPGLNDDGIDHDVLPAIATVRPRAELMGTGNKGSERRWMRACIERLRSARSTAGRCLRRGLTRPRRATACPLHVLAT